MKWIVYVVGRATTPSDLTDVWFHVHPAEQVARSPHLQQQREVYRTMEFDVDEYWEAHQMARRVIDVERRLESAVS